ncbi:hypothetical protein BDQ17DRAFT_1062312 [Cyathus striatus]|nr:hypothetical protein BDQ17DRAFT_1062312 [Cyathus striatus]
MGEKQECPSCRKSANEGHLRQNPVMEEAVVSWKSARPYVLRLCKVEEQRASSISPDGLSTPKAKKRKLGHSKARSSSPEIQIVPQSSIITSTLKSPSKSSQNKPSSSKVSVAIPRFDTSETGGAEITENNSADHIVNCPICNKEVVYKRVNAHIDSGCKNYTQTTMTAKTQSKQQWSKLLGGPRSQKDKGKQKDTGNSDDDDYPLPKASYGTLKDRALKELLAEQSLSVNGDRNQWIERHRKWVMIYNANLDRSEANRKTKAELRKELKKWEDDTRKKKSTVDDVAMYQKKQKSEFDRLVELAKKNRAKPSSTPNSSPVVLIASGVESASGESGLSTPSPLVIPHTIDANSSINIENS